jgi:hypothetical protein
VEANLTAFQVFLSEWPEISLRRDDDSGRLSTDPAGVIPSGVVVFQSTTPYFNFRWGDYSAITLDPNNASCA